MKTKRVWLKLTDANLSTAKVRKVVILVYRENDAMEESKYRKNIYWSQEDNCYIVEVPELPGCMADGKTQEEAVNNAEIVISEWVETAKQLEKEIPSSVYYEDALDIKVFAEYEEDKAKGNVNIYTHEDVWKELL